jgi:hypothetical protein
MRVSRARCAWIESERDSRISKILIQPVGWAEASRRWQSLIRVLPFAGESERLTCLVRKRQKDFDEIGQRKSSSLDSKRSVAPGTSIRLKSWKAGARLRWAITPLFG